MSRFWSPLVHQLTPYTPGEQPQIDGLVKLNTNESPYPPSPSVIEAIASANCADLRKYPDPAASKLKQALADYHGLQATQVFLGNSSDEVLAHVFRGLLSKNKPILFPDLTYSFYPVYCGLFKIDYEQIPLDSRFEIDINDYAIDAGGVIFANPNAPTGIALSLEKVAKLANMHAESVVVVDEAYVDFTDESAVSILDQCPNLLVVQTFSKSRSLAGLRVGMAFASAELIEGLERVKNSFHPYALDSLAIAGATAAVEDDAYFKSCVSKIKTTRERMVTQLRARNFEVLDSQANFVLAKHSTEHAANLFAKLRDHKIVVRYFSTPRIDNYLRISVGSNSEIDQLFDVLDTILAA